MTVRANPHRGETELRVGDHTHVLRPSFEALVAAEQDIGSLFELVERASAGMLTLTEITALLWHCIVEEPRPSKDAVGEAVLDCGLVAATKPVRVILAQVLKGRA